MNITNNIKNKRMSKRIVVYIVIAIIIVSICSNMMFISIAEAQEEIPSAGWDRSETLDHISGDGIMPRFSPDDEYLFYGDKGGNIYKVNTETWNVEESVNPDSERIWDISISDNGSYIAISTAASEAHLYDNDLNYITRLSNDQSNIPKSKFIGNDYILVNEDITDNNIVIYDINGNEVHSLDSSDISGVNRVETHDIVVNDNGTEFWATFWDDGRISKFEVGGSWEELTSISSGGNPTNIDLAEGRGEIAVTNSAGDEIIIFDSNTGGEIIRKDTAQTSSLYDGLVYSYYNDILVSGHNEGTTGLPIFDVNDSYNLIANLEHDSSQRGMSFSNDNNYLAVGFDNTPVVIYDVTGIPEVVPEYTLSGYVSNDSGDRIEDVTIQGDSFNNEYSFMTTTNDNGFYDVTLPAYEYSIDVTHNDYSPETTNINMTNNQISNFTISKDPRGININSHNFIESGEFKSYSVTYTNENFNTVDITNDNNLNIESSNTSHLMINEGEKRFYGASGVNTTVTVNATYTHNNEEYNDTKEVTVSTLTIDNLGILPTPYMIQATLKDPDIRIIIIATFLGGVSAYLGRNSWIGLGVITSIIFIGWFMGYSSVGVVIITFMYCGLTAILLQDSRRYIT